MSHTSLASAISVELQLKRANRISCWKKFTYVITHFTVEPLAFLYMLVWIMNNLVTQNMSLEKICRVNLHFNESICDALVLRNRSGYLPHHEVEVQQLVVKWAAYKAFLVGSIPVVCIIFLGSWSDRHRRRKPIILIPLFGDLIGSIGLLVCSYFFLELSIEYSWMVDTLTASLFGGQCSINLGIFSYVAGISSDEDRTLRIGSVSIATTLAISTGMFMSGFVLNLLGFVGAYSLSVSLLILAITSGMIMIKEETVKETKEDQKGYLRDFFSLEYVKNTFKICFQKKDPNKRTKMFVIMFLCTMIVGPMQGEITLNYMYLRLKCGWDEVDFSIFNAFHFCIQIFGNLFAMSFFSKYLKWDDATLGIMAMISKISSCVIYAFSPTGMYFYIGAIFEILFGSAFIAMRAIMSRVVPPHELGQSNSIFGICEGLMPFIFAPIYSKLYIVTVTAFPGTFYLFSAGLYVSALCLFMYLYISRNEGTKFIIEDQEDVQPVASLS